MPLEKERLGYPVSLISFARQCCWHTVLWVVLLSFPVSYFPRTGFPNFSGFLFPSFFLLWWSRGAVGLPSKTIEFADRSA